MTNEQAVWDSGRNTYLQVSLGEIYLQNQARIDSFNLSSWSKRLGELSMEELLAQSIEVAKRASVIYWLKESSKTGIRFAGALNELTKPAGAVGDGGNRITKAVPTHISDKRWLPVRSIG